MNHRRQTREQRASIFFALYAQSGPARSLEALRATCAALALPVHLNTLKSYSIDYGWQERVALIDREQKALEETPAARVAKMNQTQASVGELLVNLAALGAGKLKGREAEFSPQDVARLLRDGTHAWRLALGEATSREEIAVRVYSELVEAIAVVFLDANELEDKDARARRFALGAQSLIEAHAAGNPLEVRNVEQGPDSEDQTPRAGR